ncbi:MAG TPA: DNA polymerase III subunit alpha [Geminicoccaceae bacterium]|nr:DNA polymerase III subunit alpha [Geminicoccaceae bacterium]
MPYAPFVHLRVRSCYSLLESTVRLDRLLERCRRDQAPAVAITDRANLFCALEFSQSAAKAGVQPIVGCLLPVASDEVRGNGRQPAPSLLPVLVQSEAGYRALLRLLSRAHLQGDPGAVPELAPEDLAASEGLIALSGGADGPIGRALLAGNRDLAEALVLKLREAFPGRFYIELMRHGLDDEERIEPALIEIALEHDLPLVATNDAHFIDADEYEAHDVLLCISDSAQVAQTERRRLTPEHRLKNPAEMLELFADLPEAIDNTLAIARRCAFMVPSRAPILPAFPTAAGRSEVEELRATAEAGLEARLQAEVYAPGISPEEQADLARPYRERLDYELGVIEGMKYDGYFLIVADFIQWAKQQGIPVGPGRGSGAGSVVAWALSITDLDPLRFGLLFERFLNPERVSMPDFDVDFCQDRRDEVIRYVRDKYGADRVASIITFGKLQARAVLRDVGRALGLPYGQVDRVAKLVPFNPANPPTLEQALLLEPRLAEAAREDEQVERMIAIAQQLEGLPRHASTHAAGIVIGDRPLDELVPLYRDPRADMPVTQFNMKDVEKAGLVKFDFLGLTTLTMLALAERLVNAAGTPLRLAELALDDQATFELLGRAETIGIFQLESGGMRDALRKLRPDSFDHIVAMNALYRPGPMDNIPRFINCKNGIEQPEYLHPLLEPILRETSGVIIYQEQVMQIARELAGYSLGGADLLRRAMGKKIKAEMDAQREVFIEGATKRNIPRKLATTIFEQVAKFASYGFPKAHATAYALLAYHTAYLRAHHPLQFFAAAMTMDRANQDRLGLYRQDLARSGIALLPPDVNRSYAEFAVEHGAGGGAVRYALAAIRGVGAQAAEQLVAERAKGGPFADLFDLVARVGSRVLNRRLLEALIKAGALDSLDGNRQRLLNAIDLALRYGLAHAEQAASEQTSMFASLLEQPQLPKPRLPEVADCAVLERLQQEFDVLGFYLTAHPLDGYLPSLARLGVVPSSQLAAAAGQRVKLAGVVLGKQERTTARSRFAFLQLSDPSGSVEVTLFAEQLSRAREHLETGRLVLVDGEVRLDGDVVKILASSVALLDVALEVARGSGNGHAADRIAVKLADSAVAGEIEDLLGAAPGSSVGVRLVVPLEDGEVAIDLGDNHRLALMRRPDLERRSGVLEVVDL